MNRQIHTSIKYLTFNARKNAPISTSITCKNTKVACCQLHDVIVWLKVIFVQICTDKFATFKKLFMSLININGDNATAYIMKDILDYFLPIFNTSLLPIYFLY